MVIAARTKIPPNFRRGETCFSCLFRGTFSRGQVECDKFKRWNDLNYICDDFKVRPKKTNTKAEKMKFEK